MMSETPASIRTLVQEASPVKDNEKTTSETASTWSFHSEFQTITGVNKEDSLKPSLGLSWKDLTVKAHAAGADINENVFSQYNIAQSIRDGKNKPPLRTLLDRSHGCVRPGEMLLVLGRPGAGCTTLLKLLSNRRDGYPEITGAVSFGSMTHKEAEQYRGQIIMNTEEELFYPTLTAGQTLDFASRLKYPAVLPKDYITPDDYQRAYKDVLLNSMGISHTVDTKVGDAYVRGVSGGERKRVSIVECLATRGSIYCWDNSTRGLDASTALQYIKAIRAMTDILGLTTVVTLYQAGNGIYEQFDKVLVLEEGAEIYYGPCAEARPFMENLGFICEPSANTADFLTGVLIPTERKVKADFRARFPRTKEAIRAEYDNSLIKEEMSAEENYADRDQTKQQTEAFKDMVQKEKHKNIFGGDSLYTANLTAQIKACTIRQFQIIWGDKQTLFIKQAVVLAQALIAGSLFYASPENSAGLFGKGGALFLSILYNALMAMSEVTDSFTGRPTITKHNSFALLHPAAFCIGQTIADLPIALFQTTHFSLVLYFMAGLRVEVGAFFSFWFTILAITLCMTACFRAIGAAFSDFDGASKVSGFLFSLFTMYTGYMIPRPTMRPWFGWFYWINPLGYANSALLAIEFRGAQIPCVAGNLIPFGSNYADSSYQSCAGVPGAIQGETSLNGDQYLNALRISPSEAWRDIGIVWAWWALFVILTIIATSFWKESNGGASKLLIPRETVSKVPMFMQAGDEESQRNDGGDLTTAAASVNDSTDGASGTNLIGNSSVFTWKNLTYTVKTPSGDRVLLNNVKGWVKPGMLGALMGSSGAGKTTLLDVLAKRKTEGTIKGSILVDGRPLPLSFQRSAGYCEQLDVHEPFATVREALEFSAVLRQERGVSKADKLQYVDKIINLLEMHDIEHALIGTVGSGLSVEQRKRLTIGVELVAKPSLLIFLDEPTSGLDGQAAYNTVRFLKKLAAAGQAVLVTIHQPSAQLFSQFDTLLLLAKGGKTVYFGEIGDNASTIKAYFENNGAPCPEKINPAEHMIDVVSDQSKDWNEVWLNSAENAAIDKELDHIISDAASKTTHVKEDNAEFALPLWEQTKIVTSRMNTALYRNNQYTGNKFGLHIGSALFNGFSFWKIGNTVADQQLRLFTIFNFVFVAPGVINQLQPLFINRRDIYETREKKAMMYSWWAFVTGLIVSEIPYLCVCAVLYFVCWYYTCGFPSDSTKAGATFFVMLMYEFIYTGMGQFVAAYAPNAVFATMINPLILGLLVSFCGVMLPYAQINVFWRYWMYYLNPL
jgi:ATP-binding cassette subfamily G (WHITE) protein 2 (SNQ2)